MANAPLVVVTPPGGPLAVAICRTLALLCGWRVEAVDLRDLDATRIRSPRLVIIIRGPGLDAPWGDIRRLFSCVFRGVIVVCEPDQYQDDPSFRGLEDDGLYTVSPLQFVAAVAPLLEVRQYASRLEAEARAALHDEQLLARIAGGDHHPIPSLEGVAAYLEGDDAALARARRDLATAQCWLDRFARPGAPTEVAACARSRTRLGQLVEERACGPAAGGRDQKAAAALIKAWEDGWCAFASAAVRDTSRRRQEG